MADTVFSRDDITRAAANGVNYLNLYNRVNNLFWNKEAAITEPVTKRNQTWAENRDEAEANGVSRYMFNRALKEGYTVEEAVTPIQRKNGRPRAVSEELEALAEENGLTYAQVRYRKQRFRWSDERAVNQPIGTRVRHDIVFSGRGD